MAKLGVGVGEEFPVDEAAPKEPAPESNVSERSCGGGGHGHWHGYGHWHHGHGGRWHFAGHVLFRLAILALLIGGALSFFGRHFDGPHGFAPYPHHFFFPFFWIALIVALVFWRGHWRRRHWHDEPRGRDKEGT